MHQDPALVHHEHRDREVAEDSAWWNRWVFWHGGRA
jgi:hypothetical protein